MWRWTTLADLEHMLTYHRRGLTYFLSNGRGQWNTVIPLRLVEEG